MKKTKEELQADFVRARRALEKIEAAERLAENKKLIGKCFRVRNNYSVPAKPSDYWWLYTKVIGADAYNLKVFQFQIDKDGRIDINQRELYRRVSDYQPITTDAFTRAWKSVQKRVAKLKP